VSFDESLVVVGTGIRSVGQLTTEAIAWIKRADHVPYVVTDPLGESIVRSLNPNTESLSWMYSTSLPRTETYEQMVCRVMELVREGKQVCFAAYGHPGVFAFPTHEAIRRARREGYRARMLPGISAEDCLFAALGIDPASAGCQSYEASDFLMNRLIFDPTSPLVLWQIGVLGEMHGVDRQTRARGLPQLIRRLAQSYPEDHMIYLYEASLFPTSEPRIGGLKLRDLQQATLTTMTTLYIPPFGTPDTDWELAQVFGFSPPDAN